MVKRRYDRLSAGVDLDDQLGHIQKQTKVHKQGTDVIMGDLRKAYPSMPDDELKKMMAWGADQGLELLGLIGKLLGVTVGASATAGIGYMIGLSTSNPAATAALLFLAGGKIYSGVVKAEMAIQNVGSKIYTGLFKAGLSRETGFADGFQKFWDKNMKINKFTSAEAYQSTGGVKLRGGLNRNDFMQGHELYDHGSAINRVKRIYRRFKETTEQTMAREASEADSEAVYAKSDKMLTDSFQMSVDKSEARVARDLASSPMDELTPEDVEFVKAVEKKWGKPIYEIQDSVIDKHARTIPDKDPGGNVDDSWRKPRPESPAWEIDTDEDEDDAVVDDDDEGPAWEIDTDEDEDDAGFDPDDEGKHDNRNTGETGDEDGAVVADEEPGPAAEPVSEPAVPGVEPVEAVPEPVGPADISGSSDFIENYIKWKKAGAAAPVGESVDVPALSEKLGLDPTVLAAVVEEGGAEGQSVLSFLYEFGSHANLTVVGPASVAMFVYSVYSGVKQWGEMDKTRAALAATLSRATPSDPGYYDVRNALKHMDQTNAIAKAVTVGNIAAGGATTISTAITAAAATGLITIGPELAAAAVAMGVVGLVLGAFVTVAALALIVGPAVADASNRADAALDRQSDSPSGVWVAGEKDKWKGDQDRLVAILKSNPLTADQGDAYAAMGVDKFRQQYSPKWELMAPIFASINQHPESWGYKDAEAAQTALTLHRRGFYKDKVSDAGSVGIDDPGSQGGDVNATYWSGFIGKSVKLHTEQVRAAQKAQKLKYLDPDADAKEAYFQKMSHDPTMHWVGYGWEKIDPTILGHAKNGDEISRVNGHHQLAQNMHHGDAEKYAPGGNDMGDRGHAMSWGSAMGDPVDYLRTNTRGEHPKIVQDIPYDMWKKTSTGQAAKDLQGAGVVEVPKNIDKPHAGGQKGTDLALYPKPDRTKYPIYSGGGQEYRDNRRRFANWTSSNPNNHVTESHGHTDATSLLTHPSKAAPKGINQPANPKPHAGESIIGDSTEKDKPGDGLFTSHDPDMPHGSFPVRNWGNATEAPADDPTHMVEPGGSQNPFRGANPPTHSGARSGVTLGDLRVLHALNRSVLNQEPMAIAAKKNYMHSLGERAAFD